LYRDDDLEVVRIEVRHGGYSSRHKHLARDNTFLVIAGELIVTVYDDLGDDPLVIYGMQPGQACTVRSGLPHRFRSPQGDSVAFEFYTRPAVGAFGGPQDIVRFDEGGVE
jgi:mannose-6-phosphate isomerase-like protein (cupin superfamily)